MLYISVQKRVYLRLPTKRICGYPLRERISTPLVVQANKDRMLKLQLVVNLRFLLYIQLYNKKRSFSTQQS